MIKNETVKDGSPYVGAHQAFVSQQVGTFVAEAQGRVDLLQQLKHLRVMNLAP
jgi:hypothetical protein